MQLLRTVHVGLGPIGRLILRATADCGFAWPVAAADADAELSGRSVGELVGNEQLARVIVQPNIGAALATVAADPGADLVVLATGSHLPKIQADILTAVRAGLNVVSTAEELVWPWLRHPQRAQEIAEEAKRYGVTVLGTGINPGFLLDLLPLLACRPCLAVRKVTARRIVDVSQRRPQLQRKVGSGLWPEEYRALASQGRVGHVGLGESAALLAAGLGWPTGPVIESIEPVLAAQRILGEHFIIEPGQVMGSHQEARIELADGRALELVCRMTHREPDPRDEIIVDGEPPVRLRIDAGVFGDTATAGCTVGILRQVVAAPPGLLTVKDLPVA